ncbi:amino acid ABC transporter substrate-binding protein [Listeria booriae]|uniref:amino acid ABC transporter substrate-binding protein n=1 Tax=Listeria booriae TaxID=1552123 RepID=UPI0016282EB1|nr:amino acid ABC transporter substrate-binding protein [Listeria booriae]MBC2319773.1 amino acid ABC transporter substrate-binding protein [Listeria booriae]
MKKWVFGALLVVASGVLLAGCGLGTDTGASSDALTKDGKDVKTIVVGTGTQFPNICFIDDKGNLTGYDVELVKALDKKLPQYKFEFKTMDFSNLLLSLQTNKIDFVAHQMEVNDERKEKFLFNKEPYNVFPLQVAVNEKNTDIKSVADLAGKTAIVSATSNSAVYLEKYNKEHGDKINIVYSGTGNNDATNQIRTGRADATITTPFAVKLLNEQADAQQKVVGEPVLNSKVYFLLRKNESQLSNDLDGALKELKEEGVVSKLSKKWLGADYSVDF